MGAAVDRDRLARYVQLCGFVPGDTLPPTYPHVLAWPATWAVLRGRTFPLPVIGLVHLTNVIDVHCGLPVTAAPDFTVGWTNLAEHPRGRTVDVVTEARLDGAVVWREVSTYLRRSRSTPRSSTSEHPAPPPVAAEWTVDPATASAYARVSGDRNPIHTSTLAARLFGFPRRIAHGMWSAARCLAALGDRLPRQYTVDISFRAPVLLPARVAFSTDVTPGRAGSFGLHDAGSGRPHLAGSIRPS